MRITEAIYREAVTLGEEWSAEEKEGLITHCGTREERKVSLEVWYLIRAVTHGIGTHSRWMRECEKGLQRGCKLG